MFTMAWALSTVLGVAMTTEILELHTPTREQWLSAAWTHFLQRQKNFRVSDAERIQWDRLMEQGELPPGYFWDLAGHAIPETEKLELYTHMDPHNEGDAEEMGRYLYREQRSTKPVFYIDTAVVTKIVNGGQHGVEVKFDPPAKVRLLPNEEEHLFSMFDDFGTERDYIQFVWSVELLEERPELQGPAFRYLPRVQFDANAFLLEEDEYGEQGD